MRNTRNRAAAAGWWVVGQPLTAGVAFSIARGSILGGGGSGYRGWGQPELPVLTGVLGCLMLTDDPLEIISLGGICALPLASLGRGWGAWGWASDANSVASLILVCVAGPLPAALLH